MIASSEPLAQLSHLPNADGSASFSFCGYAVTAAVNGPIEAPRRDENPFEALIDVIVRPAAGVGGTADRQLESILQDALRQLIPIRDFPRCMIQVTLQITETPKDAYQDKKLFSAQTDLPIIPALLHAAILGLLTAAIPLKTLATATTVAIEASSGELIVEPRAEQADKARSLHALAFTPDGDLLMAESSGSFSLDQWDKVLQAGQRICCRNDASDKDTLMTGVDAESSKVKAFIRSIMETKAAADLH